jgi:hypothetical protein
MSKAKKNQKNFLHLEKYKRMIYNKMLILKVKKIFSEDKLI